MEFNLDSLALNDTTELHLRHPVTGEHLYADGDAKKEPVVSILYGTSSEQYRQAVTNMQNRALKRGKKPLTAEQMKAEAIELLVACSERINNLTYKGKPVDNSSAFRELYNDPKFSWLKDQHDETIGDISAFLEV